MTNVTLEPPNPAASADEQKDCDIEFVTGLGLKGGEGNAYICYVKSYKIKLSSFSSHSKRQEIEARYGMYTDSMIIR